MEEKGPPIVGHEVCYKDMGHGEEEQSTYAVVQRCPKRTKEAHDACHKLLHEGIFPANYNVADEGDPNDA